MLNADDEEQILEFNDVMSSGGTQPAEVYGELKLQVSPNKNNSKKAKKNGESQTEESKQSTQRSAEVEESVEADDDEDEKVV